MSRNKTALSAETPSVNPQQPRKKLKKWLLRGSFVALIAVVVGVTWFGIQLSSQIAILLKFDPSNPIRLRADTSPPNPQTQAPLNAQPSVVQAAPPNSPLSITPATVPSEPANTEPIVPPQIKNLIETNQRWMKAMNSEQEAKMAMRDVRDCLSKKSSPEYEGLQAVCVRQARLFAKKFASLESEAKEIEILGAAYASKPDLKIAPAFKGPTPESTP